MLASPPPCSACCHTAGTTMCPVPTTCQPQPTPYSTLISCRPSSYKLTTLNASFMCHCWTQTLHILCAHFSLTRLPPLLCFSHFATARKRKRGREEKGRAHATLRPRREWADSLPSSLLCLRPVLWLMSGACLYKKTLLFRVQDRFSVCSYYKCFIANKHVSVTFIISHMGP